MFSYPKIIEIQTHNICNADCSICPYSTYKEEYPLQKMDNTLFEKILQDLKENQSNIETIIPYLNNEPFIDKNFLEKLERIKTVLPGKIIEVSTNLSAFSEQKFRHIFHHTLINDLRISFFGGTLETYARLMPKLSFERNIEFLSKTLELRDEISTETNLSIIMVLLPTMDIKREVAALQVALGREDLPIRFFGYLDRAGSNLIQNVKPYQKSGYKLKGCSLRRNEERFCISVNGDVVLCSQDWFGQEKFGNVKDNTITEIWQGARKKLVDEWIGGCKTAPADFICRNCKLAYFDVEGEMRLNFSGDKYTDENDRKILDAIQ